jgi:hypothetical protein
MAAWYGGEEGLALAAGNPPQTAPSRLPTSMRLSAPEAVAPALRDDDVMSVFVGKISSVSSQDPEALRKAAEAVRVLEDRLVAIAQGQADVAKSLHETAEGLLIHKADDDGLTAANLDTTADALEVIARELATVADAFRMLIADALGDDASFL